MPSVDQEIILNIVNKTTAKQKVVLFDVTGAYNSENGAAQKVKYEWDITSSLIEANLYNQLALVVIAALNPNGPYKLFIYTDPSGLFPLTTVEKVVTGLNSFGIGVFTNVGNIITTYSSTYLISSINICNLSTAIGNGSTSYDINGSLIYDQGYTTGLIGNLSRINPLNPFWINGPANTVDGPANRSAIIGAGEPTSFFAELDSDSEKTVYVGISFRRTLTVFFPPASLYLNNELIWEIPDLSAAQAVAANVNTVLGTSFSYNEIMESLWHIVPVTLKKGRNILQTSFMQGLGLEVYDNTAAEIATATGYGDLNLLFSSIDYLGQQLF